MTAQTRLQRTNNDLQTSLTRLSTGLRINSGKDDPAGLIASESLRSDITSLNKALSNTQRAGQIIATADSALGQVSSLLNDIRGLVTEAANSGALSDDEIAANQLQVDSSLEAINRIAQTTTFQGRKLLDGSLDFITKAGAGAAGTAFSTNVSDLQIDQANLGTAGSVSINVSVTSAATRGSITNSGIAASTTPAKATGQLTFGTDAATVDTTLDIVLDKAFVVGAEATKNVSLANAFTPGASAKATVSLASGVGFRITAEDGKLADGKIGNYTTVKFNTVANGTDSSGSYDAGTNTLTLNIERGAVFGDILTDLNADANLADFAFDNGTGGSTQTTIADGVGFVSGLFGGAGGSGTDTLSSTATVFKLTAVNGGAADGKIGDSTTVEFTTGGSNAATYDSTTNRILVTVAANATIADIAAKINSDIGTIFRATDVANGTYKYAAADNGVNSGAFSGGSNTITPASIRVTAKQGGPAGGSVGKNTKFVFQDVDAPGDATSAAYNANTNTLTVKVAAGATINDVAAKIEANDVFIVDETLIENGTARFARDIAANDGDFGAGAVTTTVIGTAGSEYDGKIVIQSKKNDAAFNKTVTFSKVNSVAAGEAQAVLDGSGNIIVRVNDNSSVELSKIANAINTLADYTAVYTPGTGSQGNQKFDAVNDSDPTIANLTGGDQGGGLAANLAFNLSGARGSQEFQFDKGASLQNVVDAINASKDATGVEAEIAAGILKLNSTLYGSKAAVSLEVISEGAGGTFRSGLSATRATGTDIVASVNGYAATGDGNTLSLNTSTLNLKLTLTAGSTDAVAFDITGGGALFQLGGDVVSNQQARLGIGSLSTAKLGGVSGRLFELQGGRAKSLVNDITGAANVIDEVINKVTGLRGRLGAFQRTTLESNTVSLNDTLTNLNEAQSSIRDADFAKESANLTRAQILVQSGTSVLGIANQSSQSVLSLLR